MRLSTNIALYLGNDTRCGYTEYIYKGCRTRTAALPRRHHMTAHGLKLSRSETKIIKRMRIVAIVRLVVMGVQITM